jgi:hypothetical protein
VHPRRCCLQLQLPPSRSPNAARRLCSTGNKPWTNDQLSTYVQGWDKGPTPLQFNATEHWAAYVRPSDKLAVGLYFPDTTSFTSYVLGPPDRAAEPWSCSYLAPISSFRLTPGLSISFRARLYVGSVEEIRAAFSRL